ncbi:MAG: Uma2 family endonuclease [Fimbriiglobus sp.]
MAITFLDPTEAAAARSYIVTNGGTSDERPTEMWEGVEIVPPLANTEHARITAKLGAAFAAVVDWDAGDQAMGPANVSDRDADWTHNYRNPDALVVLAGGRAVDRGNFWLGGPDLCVEILSPGEDPAAKFGFYAAVGTRELLIVDRYPWALELFHLVGGRMVSAGRADVANAAVLRSVVLPLTFELRTGTPRPVIAVAHTTDGRTWTA